MSKSQRKYMREEAARGQVTQAKFGKDGSVLTSVEGIFSELNSVDVKQLVHCPFCLGERPLQNFLLSTKSGLSPSKGECRMCGRGMMLRNLLTSAATPEKYAQWVWNYARSGFWQKIIFEEWKKRLLEMGWSQAFWDKYKALKAEATGNYGSGDEEEDFESYANRMYEAQEAAHREHPGES